MKRWIRHIDAEKDEFDKQWEKKFGPEQQREFSSADEFLKWMKEVDSFEVTSDETV